MAVTKVIVSQVDNVGKSKSLVTMVVMVNNLHLSMWITPGSFHQKFFPSKVHQFRGSFFISVEFREKCHVVTALGSFTGLSIVLEVLFL